MHVERWFSTPIWWHNLNLKGEEIILLQDYCRRVKDKDNGRVLSNVGGWQSNNLMHEDITNTPLHTIFNKITPLLQNCMSDLGSKLFLHVDNAWLNINKKMDSNKIHNHDGSILSGVFYLTDNNSDIEFQRDTDILTYFLNTVVKTDNKTELSCNTVTYTPEKGNLIIFPSWVKHRVLPSTSDHERISVAFNTYVSNII